jgi:hypothetical protein
MQTWDIRSVNFFTRRFAGVIYRLLTLQIATKVYCYFAFLTESKNKLYYHDKREGCKAHATQYEQKVAHKDRTRWHF